MTSTADMTTEPVTTSLKAPWSPPSRSTLGSLSDAELNAAYGSDDSGSAS